MKVIWKPLLVFLFLLFVMQSISPLRANPYLDHKSVNDPAFVEPPTIMVTSPLQDSTYSSNETIILSFNVSGPDAPNLITKYLLMVDYKGDWMVESLHAYRTKNFEVYTPDDFPFNLTFNINLSNVPLGRHSIVITAFGSGGYAEGLTWYSFDKNSSSTVIFVVDKIPKITLLSFENTTFANSSIPLDFTIDQPVSKITYRLDGEEPIDIAGNTTLSHLNNGYHNVTIYATNEFGSTGTSEVAKFMIDKLDLEQNSSLLDRVIISIAIFTAIACFGLGILAYRRHRKAARLNQ